MHVVAQILIIGPINSGLVLRLGSGVDTGHDPLAKRKFKKKEIFGIDLRSRTLYYFQDTHIGAHTSRLRKESIGRSEPPNLTLCQWTRTCVSIE